jgi:hypothetical protein
MRQLHPLDYIGLDDLEALKTLQPGGIRAAHFE